MTDNTLARLTATIASRRSASAENSYTKSLLEKGVGACARKMGEEAVETIIAALSEDNGKLCAEAADLIYHLLVLLEARNLPFEAVLEELDRRTSQSGLAEKASRNSAGGGA
jgi:phosphoribosyl-ATP pyrophosphohydrolase